MSRFKSCALVFWCLIVVLGLCSCELALEGIYGKPAFSKINVLVYGNDYKNSPKGVINGVTYTAHQLNYTIKDAEEVGKALGSLGGTVTTSLNTSKKDFRSAMEVLADNSKPSELTIIYFSCHGFNEDKAEKKAFEEERKTSFIMCSDTSETFDVYTHAEFKEDLAKISGTKVVFTDVCYSGGLVENGNVAVNTNEYTDIDAFSLFWDYQVSEDPSTFYLTAARYNQQSFESSINGHGVFTSSLLEALGWDEASEKISGVCGEITFFGICQYVVKNNTSSGVYRQDPMLSSGSNDVILFYVK